MARTLSSRVRARGSGWPSPGLSFARARTPVAGAVNSPDELDVRAREAAVDVVLATGVGEVMWVTGMRQAEARSIVSSDPGGAAPQGCGVAAFALLRGGR